MGEYRIPRQGEIFYHDKDRPCQIVVIAAHKATGEEMAVYQELYGDFKTYVLPLSEFLREADDCRKRREADTASDKSKDKDQNADQNVDQNTDKNADKNTDKNTDKNADQNADLNTDMNAEVGAVIRHDSSINSILNQFLESKSYIKKLEVISLNKTKLDDRLINDMAASLDCTVDDGPIEVRIRELLHCLQTMSRFEDRRRIN